MPGPSGHAVDSVDSGLYTLEDATEKLEQQKIE